MRKTILFITIITTLGCQKLNQAPSYEYTDANYWTTPANAQQLLNTAYSQMLPSDYFFYNEGLSDNAYNGRNDVDNVFSISSGSFNPSLGRFDQEWSSHYAGIKSCNVLLDNIDRIPNYPQDQKTLVEAQARFLRAYLYFQLMTWFGDVPLFDHDITLAQSQSIARTPAAQVLAFVQGELNWCQANLPVNTAVPVASLGMVTSGAAMALKARVALYQNDWQTVAAICDTLINMNTYGTYVLVSNYANIFSPTNEHNSEVILDEEFVPNERTYDWLFDFIPISAGARDNALCPTQELINDYLMMNGDTIGDPNSGYDINNPYNNRDPRMTATLVYNDYVWTNPDGSTQVIYIKPGTDPNSAALNEWVPNGGFSSPSGYYYRKYFDPTAAAGETSGLDLILIRYADVLLMYAEAENELGQMSAPIWNQTIGALRARAGFTDPNATAFNPAWDQPTLRSIIRRERRCELALEGLRIFDIRRWRTAEIVLNGYPHGAQYGDPTIDNGFVRLPPRTFDPSRNYLWPIPLFELEQNSNLTQNPNY
jgi:hypothetical protein